MKSVWPAKMCGINSRLFLEVAEDEDAEGRNTSPEAPGGEFMSQPSILLKALLEGGEVRTTHCFDEEMAAFYNLFLLTHAE